MPVIVNFSEARARGVFFHFLIIEAFVYHESQSFRDDTCTFGANVIVEFRDAYMRVWTAFAEHSFCGYVVVGHYAGIHTAKIDFADIIVSTHYGFINESSAVTN